VSTPIHLRDGGLWRHRRSGAELQPDRTQPLCGARIWTLATGRVGVATCEDCLEFLLTWEKVSDADAQDIH
jgi:hypothetical protein